MGRNKKDKSIELISKTIIEEGTDKKPVEVEKPKDDGIDNLVANKTNTIIDFTMTSKSTDNFDKVNQLIQSVYNLGYADGKTNHAQRSLSFDIKTGTFKGV